MAIAFDAATDGGFVNPGTVLGYAHTCSGSNRLLIVNIIGGAVGNGDLITTVTYAGVAMTLVKKVDVALGGSIRWIYQYLLVNPASGTNGVAVSSSGSMFIAAHSISYTGCAQTAQPNVSALAVASASASLTVTVTSTVDNCWLVGFFKNDGTTNTGGTGTTSRLFSATGTSMSCDSNGVITPAGSASLVGTGSTNFWSGIVAAIAPIPAVLSAGNMLAVL